MMTNDLPQSNELLHTFRFSKWRFGVLSLIILLLGACAGLNDDIEDTSSPAAGMIRLAGFMREKGDLMGALDFYQRALQKEPNNAIAYKQTAMILDSMGDLPTAETQYREAVKLSPKDAELHRNYGKLLIALEKPADARKEFIAALDIDSDDPKSLNGLAIALDYLGEHKDAQRKYEAALDIDKGNLSAINNLAYSYILTGDYSEAIKLLEPELKNPAATPALRQNLALAYGLSGMDMDAERVAKMDLSAKQVKENMEYYKRQRAELSIETTPYAELGTYSTEALAVAQIESMQPRLNNYGVDLKPVISPEIATPGGTPRFTVKMMGCTKPDDVKILCDQLALSGIPCVARGKQ